MGLPLVVNVGLGWRLAFHERLLAQQQMRDLVVARLRDTAGAVEGLMAERERDVAALADRIDRSLNSVRDEIRQSPYMDHVFVLSADGTLLHPDPSVQLSQSERQFVVEHGDFFVRSNPLNELPEAGEGTDAVAGGWIVRFSGPGLQLFYCARTASGRVVGLFLQRARWMSDLVGALPETDPMIDHVKTRTMTTSAMTTSAMKTRLRLVDSNGQSVYEWGVLQPSADDEPIESVALSYPLSSWQLQYFADSATFSALGRSAYFNLLSIAAAAGVILLAAGWWLFREYRRNVREAMQRVSFVNQVSHELKTPLTNIRMYAELLNEDMSAGETGAQGQSRKHLNVIVEESQRLSRLIGNVLTLAGRQRGQLVLRARTAVVDEVIDRVLEQFEPALRRSGLAISFERGAPGKVRVDVDLLEQVMGNLLGNVEKYAAGGKRLDILSRCDADMTVIEVADQGPGIPAWQREKIFQPFHRLSNDIAHAPGTGIGLTIARELARLHGGDLRLLPSAKGARFELRLRTPAVNDGGDA